jgi:hypothetical protein
MRCSLYFTLDMSGGDDEVTVTKICEVTVTKICEGKGRLRGPRLR